MLKIYEIKKSCSCSNVCTLLPSTIFLCPLLTNLALDHVLLEILPDFERNEQSSRKLDGAFLPYGALS